MVSWLHEFEVSELLLVGSIFCLGGRVGLEVWDASSQQWHFRGLVWMHLAGNLEEWNPIKKTSHTSQ